MIYGIRTFPPGKQHIRTIAPHEKSPATVTPWTFSPGQLPLNNPPAQLPIPDNCPL